MKDSSIRDYIFIVLIGVLIAALKLSPQPRAAVSNLAYARQAIATGELLEASRFLSDAGLYFPWRYELSIQAGRYAMEAGDAALAIQYFERPGTISHLSYDDKVILGDAYLANDEPYLAEALWKSLNETNPSDQVRQRLLELYRARKDYTSIIDQLQSMLEHYPSHTGLNYQLGMLYAATEPTQALPYLIQAVELDPKNAANARLLHDKIRTANLFDNPAYTFLIAGRQLANSNEWELATVAFEHAIELEPEYADAWAFLGEARGQVAVQEEGTISAAGLYELDHAMQLDPGSVLVNTLMGLHWERQQDFAQAQAYIEKAIRINPNDAYLYSELGSILSKAGDLPAAQSAYETAIRVNPSDPLFYRTLAEFALRNQIQIRTIALPAARQAVTIDPKGGSSLDLFGQVMLALEDYQTAERYLNSAISADPGFAPAYLHLGTVYLYTDKPELARQYLSLAQAIKPESWVNAQATRMLDYYFP